MSNVNPFLLYEHWHYVKERVWGLDETEGNIDLAWRKSTKKQGIHQLLVAIWAQHCINLCPAKPNCLMLVISPQDRILVAILLEKVQWTRLLYQHHKYNVSLFHIQVAHAWLITWFSASRTMSLANEFSPVQTWAAWWSAKWLQEISKWTYGSIRLKCFYVKISEHGLLLAPVQAHLCCCG